MAHPYHHSLSSVKKWGGGVADYQPIHDWFDESKKITPTSATVRCDTTPRASSWPRRSSAQPSLSRPAVRYLSDGLANSMCEKTLASSPRLPIGSRRFARNHGWAAHTVSKIFQTSPTSPKQVLHPLKSLPRLPSVLPGLSKLNAASFFGIGKTCCPAWSIALRFASLSQPRSRFTNGSKILRLPPSDALVGPCVAPLPPGSCSPLTVILAARAVLSTALPAPSLRSRVGRFPGGDSPASCARPSFARGEQQGGLHGEINQGTIESASTGGRAAAQGMS